MELDNLSGVGLQNVQEVLEADKCRCAYTVV